MKEITAGEFAKRMKAAVCWREISKGDSEADENELLIGEILHHAKDMKSDDGINVIVSVKRAKALTEANGFSPRIVAEAVDDLNCLQWVGNLPELSYFRQNTLKFNIYKTEMMEDREVLVFGDDEQTVKITIW